MLIICDINMLGVMLLCVILVCYVSVLCILAVKLCVMYEV